MSFDSVVIFYRFPKPHIPCDEHLWLNCNNCQYCKPYGLVKLKDHKLVSQSNQLPLKIIKFIIQLEKHYTIHTSNNYRFLPRLCK